VVYKRGTNSLVGYHITGAPFSIDDKLYVDVNGNKIDAPTGNSTYETPTRFLYYYNASKSPIEDSIDIAVGMDGTPSACEIKTGLTGWVTPPSAPDYCFAPITALPKANMPGNTALTGSCLTSFT